MPENGLPVNKTILTLLSTKPAEVYRSKAVETLKEQLNTMRKNLTSLKFSVNNGEEKIKEECIELRNQVQLATEQTIQQINDYNDEFIREIKQFEENTIQTYRSNEMNIEKANKIIKELDEFDLKWTQYLKQTKINDDEIIRATNEANNLNNGAKQEQSYLNNFIFKNGALKFIKGSVKLEKSILGAFELKGILSKQQMEQLMKLCGFSSDLKWKLIYKATRDGFGSNDFHSKCDNQSNTFVIIKSTNGNVFGGFTEQNWVGQAFRSDPNAFIFSFINKDDKSIIMKSLGTSHAIYGASFCGPTFGYPFDLSICDYSNTICESCSNLGNGYKHPSYAKDTNEAKSFLAGSHKFLTTEIEDYTK
jgi:hypothetical protein